MEKIVVTFFTIEDGYKKVHSVSFVPGTSMLEIIENLTESFGYDVEILDIEVV